MRTSNARTELFREVGRGQPYSPSQRATIFQGCSATTLAEIFHMKRQNVERRLTNCPVAGTSPKGTPLYLISEAARYLVRLKLTDKMVYETLKAADPKDFPAMTNKMFWEGLAVRRKYEE